MKGILIFLSLLSMYAVTYCTDMGSCGKPSWDMSPVDEPIGGARIVGGGYARIGTHPWIVSLDRADGNGHHCGGSLIRVSEDEETDIVLTAAHCVYDVNTQQQKPLDKEVIAGLYSLSARRTRSQQTVSAEKSIWHKGYPKGGTEMFNDIAIIKLDTPIKFTNIIQPICLPTPEVYVKNGTKFIVAGWGLTNETDNDGSDILLQVSLPIIGHEDCAELFKGPILDEMMVCAGGEGGKDSCQGDSGGPAIVKTGDIYVQQGLLSFTASGCGRDGLPSVYTRVSNYICWIYQQVRKHSAVYKRNTVLGDLGFLSGIADCGGPGSSIVKSNKEYIFKCANGRTFKC